MKPEDVVAMLREEASACRQSLSGEYSTAFWVVNIVLENLAKRIETQAEDVGGQP
jgi:hypothetical protein